MFEVGKEYTFTLLSRDEGGVYEHARTWEVTAVEGNLLHLLGPDLTGNEFLALEFEDGENVDVPPRETMILNTGSAFFHSARATEEVKAENKRRLDTSIRSAAKRSGKRATGMTA